MRSSLFIGPKSNHSLHMSVTHRLTTLGILPLMTRILYPTLMHMLGNMQIMQNMHNMKISKRCRRCQICKRSKIRRICKIKQTQPNLTNQIKTSVVDSYQGWAGWPTVVLEGIADLNCQKRRERKRQKNSCYKRYKSQIAQTNAKDLPPEFHLYNHLHKYVSSQECVGKTGSTIASHAKIVTLLSPTIGSLWLLFWRLSNARSLTQGNTNFKTILTAQNAPKLYQPNNVVGSSHSSTALLDFRNSCTYSFSISFP